MKNRLTVVWAAVFLLAAQGCILADDFPDEPEMQANPVATPREQVEQQMIEARWAGLFYDPRPATSDKIGLLAVGNFGADGQARFSFDHTYAGNWEVNDELEVVLVIEQVEGRAEGLDLQLEAGDELIFRPQLVQRDDRQVLERVEAVVEIASGLGGSVRTTIELRRESEAQLSLGDLDGDWRTEQSHALNGRNVQFGLQFRATQRQARYGPIWDEDTFVETLSGRALVFPCGAQSCWGVHQVENIAVDPPEAIGGFGGHIDEGGEELRIYIPIFRDTVMDVSLGTRQ